MTPLIAHAGHWFADLLYVAPLAAALGFLVVQARRDRRREAEEGSTPPAGVPPAG